MLLTSLTITCTSLEKQHATVLTEFLEPAFPHVVLNLEDVESWRLACRVRSHPLVVTRRTTVARRPGAERPRTAGFESPDSKRIVPFMGRRSPFFVSLSEFV